MGEPTDKPMTDQSSISNFQDKDQYNIQLSKRKKRAYNKKKKQIRAETYTPRYTIDDFN